MNYLELPPLIAAADVWEIVIGAIFFILYAVGQLMGGRDDAKKKKQKQQRPRPRPQQQPVDLAGGGPPQKPRNQEEALRSEVEDFLRRAQGKPEKPRPVQPREPQPIQLEVVTESQPAKPTLAQPMPRRKNLREEGVAEHVAKHLNTSDIAEHSDALGDKVALADDRLEAHLHQKFDHNLGSLQHQETATEANPQADDVAANIAAMLRSPQGVRQLVIANEILRRPEW